MGWQRGDVIMWCYRREVVPARVVQDAESLVVWIASGTPLLTSMPVDGRGLRERPVEERFTTPRNFTFTEWFGAGVLRVAYPDEAHSSWLFRHPDDHDRFWGWYGNLETPIVRSDVGVHASDHVLDLWLDASGTVAWKDEDELESAVAVAKFTTAEATEIRTEGERVYAAMERRDPPYDGSWLDWRPDPSWTIPELPDEYRRLAGEPARDVFPEYTTG